MHVLPLTLFALLLSAGAALAQAAEDTTTSITLSRHHTTNALDAPLALEDWYTTLRGSVETSLSHEIGTTTITADGQFLRYDTYDIENDVAAGIGAETTMAISERVELRGTFSLNVVDEGDELDLGDVLLGIRTRKTIFAAGLQGGFRLSPDTILALEGALSRELPGKTRFEQDVIAPTRLDPVRDRLRIGAALTQTSGRFTYGVLGASGLMRSDPLGLLPELMVLDYKLALQGGVTFENGARVAASVGMHGLRLLDSEIGELRASYEIAAETPLPAGFSLRGIVSAGYDAKSNDDPVATWARRLEVEAGYKPGLPVSFGLGLYLEERENIGLETNESARGVYTEAVWQAREDMSLTFRVDASRKRLEPMGPERKAVDIHLALNAKL
ncbi:hypothetical protein [Mesorhizobium sp. CAU 1741]|uniref:hypothetical protein n=1 Tax=Mesorhizobium sp. CAU 1741 TaxID=3140366 RepID=UPI00325B0A4C